MAFTTEDLVQLDEAIVGAELTVKIDGREITYRSMADLRQARRMVVRALARQAGVKANPLAGITTRLDRGIR
ncbi:phage head-tail joining protein [Enterovibrio norvegicus]|uniref:phage head-tail joining protein n=1 Tax=Enterovibrio norvegicus TaxID=188144 RepID=UPI000C81EDF2|nr:hypothetical protein [Enterovibrio norvegicus]PMN73165.1 hypothetical protein BCT27_12535 [Enterovibrio norvegicus]